MRLNAVLAALALLWAGTTIYALTVGNFVAAAGCFVLMLMSIVGISVLVQRRAE